MGSAGTGKPPVMTQGSIFKGGNSKHQANVSMTGTFDVSSSHTPSSKVVLRSAQAALLEQNEQL